jgi:hypothetical protein
LIANLLAVIYGRNLLLLLPNESPNLIYLNALASYIRSRMVLMVKLGAADPDLDHEAHDRIPVCVGHSFRRADRITLNQSPDDLGAASRRKAVHFATPSIHLHYNSAVFIDMSIHLHYILFMKTTALQIRVDDREKHAFDEAAKLAGVSFSAWARLILRRAAIREFEDAGRRPDFYPPTEKGE